MKEESSDRIFYRQLYSRLEKFINKLNSEEWRIDYSADSIRRMTRMELFQLQGMLIGFAKSKGWLDSKFDLEKIEKRCKNGRCKDCD